MWVLLQHFADISSEDHANHANIIDDHNEEIYHGHPHGIPEEDPTYSYLNADGPSSHDGHQYVEEPTYSYTDTEGISPDFHHHHHQHIDESKYTYLNPEDAPHDTTPHIDLPSYPNADAESSPHHFNTEHAYVPEDASTHIPAEHSYPTQYEPHTHTHTHAHEHTESFAPQQETYRHQYSPELTSFTRSKNGSFYYETNLGPEYSRFSKDSPRRNLNKAETQTRRSSTPKKTRQTGSKRNDSKQTARNNRSQSTEKTQQIKRQPQQQWEPIKNNNRQQPRKNSN